MLVEEMFTEELRRCLLQIVMEITSSSSDEITIRLDQA